MSKDKISGLFEEQNEDKNGTLWIQKLKEDIYGKKYKDSEQETW